jgi:hypothetical protein
MPINSTCWSLQEHTKKRTLCSESMARAYTLSVDGSCTGRWAACAAVPSIDEEIVDEISRALPQVDGYVLASEIAGVALASELVGEEAAPGELTVEVDNPDVPRVIEDGYRPKQFSRIPGAVSEAAISFRRMHDVCFRVQPRHSTAGLRRAHRLASTRLWGRR